MIEGGIPYTLELEMDILWLWTVRIRLVGLVRLVLCELCVKIWLKQCEEHGEIHCQRIMGHAGAAVVPSGAWQHDCVSTSWTRKPLMRLSAPPPFPWIQSSASGTSCVDSAAVATWHRRLPRSWLMPLIKVWWEIPQETIAHVIGSTFRSHSEYI